MSIYLRLGTGIEQASLAQLLEHGQLLEDGGRKALLFRVVPELIKRLP